MEELWYTWKRSMNYKTLIIQILINVIICWQIAEVLLMWRLLKLKNKKPSWSLNWPVLIYIAKTWNFCVVQEVEKIFQEASRTLLIVPVNLFSFAFAFHLKDTELRLNSGGWVELCSGGCLDLWMLGLRKNHRNWWPPFSVHFRWAFLGFVG